MGQIKHIFSAVFCFCLLGIVFSGQAQCVYGGTNYGNVTPAGVGQSYSLLNYVWGGDQYTLDVTNGCAYTIQMCGTSWDTYITVFNNSNVPIAWNDDSCGLQSIVTFTATYSGTVTIQVNQWPCIINSNSAENFVVTWVSCSGSGCTNVSACNYDPAATSDDGSCCFDECVTINAGGGTFDEEISWELVYNSVVIASGAGTSTMDLCLIDDCYDLNLYDSFGDGWNGANISVTASNGDLYFSGTLGSGSFVTLSFCTEPPLPPCYDPEPSGCPSIDAGADIAVPACTDPCTDLAIACSVFETGNTNSYSVCNIDFSPPYPMDAGTPIFIGVDDVFSNVITLPFDFCFYGQVYNQAVIGANGLISFDLSLASQCCYWQFNNTLPAPSNPVGGCGTGEQLGFYNASINGAYHDMDPSLGGVISYAILGTYPCRVFLVNWYQVPHYSCDGGIFSPPLLTTTQQIVLYETTNVAEVYLADKPVCSGWNNGNAAIGIQNETGTVGLAPASRNTSAWSASNEAWRFTPNGTPNFEVNWYDQSGWLGSGLTVDICPSDNAQTYVAEATYTMCDGTTVVVSDDVVVSCQAILMSVEWLNFDAKWINNETEVLCAWATASENNSAYFLVQRSADGVFWEELGTVASNGYSQQTSAYHFVDTSPLWGGAYYRAVEVDVNGEETESEIHFLERSMLTDISIGPNPSSGIFSFNRSMEGLTLRIRDARGRQVPWSWLEGYSSFELRSVSEGVYFVEWGIPNQTMGWGHEKLIVSR
jgi:hypothetical protein